MPTKKLDDSDSESDFWREFKKARAEKRGENRDASLNVLEQNHVPTLVRNNGAHIIIRFGNIWVDFWPGTGLWRAYRPETAQGRGVFRLLHWLNRHDWKSQIYQPEPASALLTSPTGRISNSTPEIQEFPESKIGRAKAVAALFQHRGDTKDAATPLTPPDVTPDDSSMPPWD